MMTDGPTAHRGKTLRVQPTEYVYAVETQAYF